MLQRLIRADAVEFGGCTYEVSYYEVETNRGGRRHYAEIVLSSEDRIILDGDSVDGLESKVSCLGPATVYSRVLAARRSAA